MPLSTECAAVLLSLRYPSISYINNDDGFTLIVWPFAVSYTLMEF